MMEIKQIRILTTKMEDPNDKEKQIDTVSVALLHDSLEPTSDDQSPKEVEFITAFPTDVFNSPAGFGLAIEIAFKGFNEFLAKRNEVPEIEAEPVN